MIYAPGDFSFIKNISDRKSLKYDYDAVEKLGSEAWEALKNHDPKQSFIWDTHGEIWNKITTLMWDGHSGVSYSINLRHLEKIAKYGWDHYVNSF
jgi:hypothetical protein